jgi:uncharacterized protein YjbJ (UPF0337 family)
MDKNHLEGIGHLVKGAVKEGLGKIIGDVKLASDGSAERTSGETQYAAGADNLVGIDSDRIKGIGHQLKGALKEGLGHITGDPKLEADGVAEREAGKAQNAAGSARDVARDALRDGQAAIDTSGEADAPHVAPKHTDQSD